MVEKPVEFNTMSNVIIEYSGEMNLVLPNVRLKTTLVDGFKMALLHLFSASTSTHDM